MIEVDDLTVRFGGVIPLDRMTRHLPGRHLRAHRAERRRQDDVLQRAERVRPARTAARVRAFGDDLLAMPDFRRARWGVRRTFQTEQAIANLSVFDNVLLVHEHTGGARAVAPPGRARRHRLRRPRATRRASRSACSAPASAGSSRWPEPSSASPASCCSTSRPPACPTRRPSTSPASSGASRSRPARSSILVDHDMSLVSACCETTAVLDFGRLIASGPTADVLRDEQVIRAYLGTEMEV